MEKPPHELIDTTRPHAARIYDYYLGGKDWFEPDRQAAQQILDKWPVVAQEARANRAFMRRATRTLAERHGVRQFLDIGTGIPTEPNLHQVAQSVAPEARVVYVDNDPLVVEYADALLRSRPEGRTTYVEADVRTDAIFDAPRLRETLDLSQPVALSLVALLHFVNDAEDPYALVRRLWEPLAPGSFLVLTHVTDEQDAEGEAGDASDIYRSGGISLCFRSREEVEGFFAGLELLTPGVVAPHLWHPHTGDPEPSLGFLAGVGRKGNG